MAIYIHQLKNWPHEKYTIYNTTQKSVQVYNVIAWYSNVHFICENYGGGIVFYVYDNGQHGLIASTADQSTGIRWYGGSSTNTRARANGVGVTFGDWYLPSKYEDLLRGFDFNGDSSFALVIKPPIIKKDIKLIPHHSTLIHFKHTGRPTFILFQVSVNNPVCLFLLKITISSLFWLPTNKYFSVGSKLKLRGAIPNVD